MKTYILLCTAVWFLGRGCAASPDWNAVEGTAGDAAKCQSEARAAFAGCDAGTSQCNAAARDAFAACKKRVTP